MPILSQFVWLGCIALHLKAYSTLCFILMCYVLFFKVTVFACEFLLTFF